MGGLNEQDLEHTLAELEAALAKRRRWGRHDARALLLAIGRCLLDEPGAVESAPMARARQFFEAQRALWEPLVQDEIAFATVEHARSADPRYLTLPNYDFAYVIRAREDLEARLLAADALGCAPLEEVLERIAKADEILAPYLERRVREA